jgi:ubiquinone/menaquinone biosynthesis C-methylase UbiE
MLADVQKRFYERTYAVQSAPRASLSGRLVARFEQHRVDAVADLVERGGCMLDIGCGDGRLVSRCSHWFDRVIGLDVAAVRLRRAADSAAHRGLGNVSYAAANVDTGLPILDASVDVATIVAVLGLIFDPLAALDELHRVLRPGGQLVLEVLNLAYLPRRVALVFGRLPRHSTAPGWDGGHLHNFTQAALAEALVAHGFRVDRWTGSGVLAPMRTWRPSLLTGNLIAVCRKL